MKKYFLLVILLIQCVTLKLSAHQAVFIHGFMLRAHSLLPLSNFLERTGYCVHLWQYPSQRFTIECNAKYLVESLKELAACNPGEPIDFIAHSTGGVILKVALSDPECPIEAQIGKAVLVATPNFGSTLARNFSRNPVVSFFMGKGMGWQLMHYSPCEMINLGTFPCTMQVLTLSGSKGVKYFDEPNDGLLTVNETLLNTPSFHKTFFLTHGNLLTASCSIEYIRDFLFGCNHFQCCY